MLHIPQDLQTKAMRYGFLGIGFATLYFCVVYGMQVWGGLGPTAATCVGYAVIVPLHYIVHARVTFRIQVNHAQALPRHLVWQVVSCLLGAGLTGAAATIFHATPLAAAVLSTLMVNGMGFVMSVWWIFRPAETRTAFGACSRIS